ncbi:gag protein [Neisseria meningitidis N1568]|uniref:DUF1759 domain-containing protein n=1 Tax=Neisseria meningitidis TaxID=487 RepID=UPI0001FBF731|nr:DUF1759 domain-containing protein [Neisseria meningitidis]EGC50146.1 gag protein [Neisseria meningitidis N1568]
MSSIIIKGTQPAKEKIEKLLEEVKQMDLSPLDQMVTKEETQRQYEARKRMIEEKIMRFELHISTLETANAEWKQYIQQLPTATRKREEEEKYAQMVDNEKGILNLINEGKEAIIILKMYKNDCELVLQRLSQHQTKDELTHLKASTKMALHQTVNLPQLPLPIFSGNPNEWRGFWSSFDAAVHQQIIPDIQKLNYLMACLKGEASKAIRGYDITPENYHAI